MTASYAPFGTGCPAGTTTVGGRPGQLPPPQLAAEPGSLPVRGTEFGVRVRGVGNAPLVLLGLGLSNTSTGGVPLPIGLGAIGMPACSLWIDPLQLDPMALVGGDAVWTARVPLAPQL